MYIHFSSFTSLYVSKYFFAPIFSALDCLCTSLYLVLIIWLTAINSLPCLRNQLHSSPVLCSSSLQDFLSNFPISDFLSATRNILILVVDCIGFGGLEVACWPLVPKFAGSNPAEAIGFLRAKKSSARLPSEGK